MNKINEGIIKYDNICTRGIDEFKNETLRKIKHNKYQIKGQWNHGSCKPFMNHL
jgi:hypothetical protein